MTRLELERAEMQALFPQFSLKEERGTSFWQGQVKGYQIRIEYPYGYPYGYPTNPLRTFASPRINNHHHYSDGQLCLWETHQWSPDFTPATVVGIVLRFIDEHQRGRI